MCYMTQFGQVMISESLPGQSKNYITSTDINTFKIDFSKKKKIKKKNFEPCDFHYENIEKSLNKIKIPKRFDVQTILDSIRKFDETDSKKISNMETHYNERYEIMKFKFLIETDLTTPGKSEHLLDWLEKYCRNMIDTYKKTFENLKTRRNNISYFLYATDFSNDFLDIMAESIRLDELILLSLMQVLDKFLNEFFISGHHSKNNKESLLIKSKIARLRKESIRSIIKKHMIKIDEIFEYGAKMEECRIQIDLFIDIWNCKTVKEIPSPEKYSYENLDKKEFDRLLNSLNYVNENCRFFIAKNYPASISEYLTNIADNIKLTWSNMIETIIPSH